MLKQKMFYTTCGYSLLLANILLIDTRFNAVGLVFGIIGAGYFIKALSIKQ